MSDFTHDTASLLEVCTLAANLATRSTDHHPIWSHGVDLLLKVGAPVESSVAKFNTPHAACILPRDGSCKSPALPDICQSSAVASRVVPNKHTGGSSRRTQKLAISLFKLVCRVLQCLVNLLQSGRQRFDRASPPEKNRTLQVLRARHLLVSTPCLYLVRTVSTDPLTL